MLVVASVALALLRARAARSPTRLQRSQLSRGIGIGLAAEDAAGVDAGVGAVEAQSQAALEIADVLLGQRRVGADRAHGRADRALVDAPGERRRISDQGPWMGLQDRLDTHVAPFSAASWRLMTSRGAPGIGGPNIFGDATDADIRWVDLIAVKQLGPSSTSMTR